MKTLILPSIAEMNLTSICAALGDPIRMKIVQCLADSGEKNCSGFEVEHISKSTLSHHIKILRESGLIQPRFQGKEHFYSLRTADLESRFPGLIHLLLREKPESFVLPE
ncbi:helix-turn-helix transcriptional regulator [Saccharibacillus sp. JS10]|uniref:ArsR/SmtB family transcription factor n=1 Tax=Saccharibacillus sp. JS10 TaxID=2950552 RepID=UPI0021087874|nr:metalloregulator ArsR/SmtB family transcription factor [Saccharibacillus sp. JS10]MCQ4087897.1 metalloregulator ArsR/SmtB family transcription factor [Saccharibacillus sp. JS10]